MPAKRTPKKAPPKKRRSSADWKPAFLEAFANSCNVRASCRIAGVGRSTVYDRRDTDPQFAAEWEQAKKDAIDVLRAVAWERARATSDTLLIFLLKSHEPETYREMRHVEHSGSLGLTLMDAVKESADDADEGTAEPS